jgi:glycosyltransferase involved in cell wall biosynthesis
MMRLGGSEARVMWLIEALKRDCDVTVVTTMGWNLTVLNEFYGTSLCEQDVTVRLAPVPRPFRTLEAATIMGAFYQRFASEIAGEYDLRISAYNPTDWGLPAIHFVADFSWFGPLRENFDKRLTPLIYRDSIFRRMYLRTAALWGKPSGRDVLREDLVIANSNWTAALLKEHCGVKTAPVVYPSVWAEFSEVPWEEKEQAFVMIGRIAPEKRVERVIAILDAVRCRGYDIRLHLCGHIGNDAYGRRISKLCGERREWIIQEGQVKGQRKSRILANCRFGIHTREAEPFGIAVAEMVKAGAIVFAPNDGGQAEVLGHPDLLFAHMDDAAEKIIAVLSDREKQKYLRVYLAGRSQIFGSERFIKAATALVLRTAAPSNAAPGIPLIRNAPPIYRPKVVIGHPMMGLGGSESNVMWLIQALREDCEVTVLTTRGWELSKLNQFYGTSVGQSEVKVRFAPVPRPFNRLSAAALRGACYQRFAAKIAGEFDIRISAYNPTDWGLPAVHFVADFTWYEPLRENLDKSQREFIYRESLLRAAYLRAVGYWGRPTGREFLHKDFIIANSNWTAKLLKEHCGVECGAVIYPSVWAEFPIVRWDEKESSFVMIGRIAPEKRVERAIAILDSVRRRGFEIKFHICGNIGDDAYGQRIARLCRERSEWIVVEGQVAGEKKAQILGRCKFGIQAREAEPFGIAVAEMLKAGAIVFAPNAGGQAEVLNHPLLLYDSQIDATERISAVLANADQQALLREHLRAQAQLFSATAFQGASRDVILPRFQITRNTIAAK